MAQTPVPTASWQAGGNLSNSSGFPADTQIAVSEKSVVVTARAVIAFYDKAGAPLQPPISTQSFFSSLNLWGRSASIHTMTPARSSIPIESGSGFAR
jgi:hypothetical protein